MAKRKRKKSTKRRRTHVVHRNSKGQFSRRGRRTRVRNPRRRRKRR